MKILLAGFLSISLIACVTSPNEKRVTIAECLGGVDSVTVDEASQDTVFQFKNCEVIK